ERSHPSIAYLQNAYPGLANYYQLASGSGGGQGFNFDIFKFSERFNAQAQAADSALKRREEEGLIQFNESFHSPSQLHIPGDAVSLYQFQVANSQYDPLIKMLLRLYGGELFSTYIRISESQLARALKISRGETTRVL